MTTDEKERALLVSAYENPKLLSTCEDHLNELALLTETYGAEVVGKTPCLVRKHDAATFLTIGKVEELVELSRRLNANLVIIDDEIAPSQQRNLEELFKIPVIDRTELILEVFAQRAQTKEAKLQVDLAKIRYESPRLKRLWTHLSRQQGTAGGGGGGGGGYLKGEGEKQIEIDRRIIKRKIDALKSELEEVKANRSIQRGARERSSIPTFAIVGYTNAGKSTLLNALTDAGVFVEDKLFATLDTTTRKFFLPDGTEILLIDTVGFIRKLPHHLVAAFKSTLEEALFADVLLDVVDVSDPALFEHVETTYAVLKELGAEDRPILHLLNKAELIEDPSVFSLFKMKYPNAIELSALKKEGLDLLLQKMQEEVSKRRNKVRLKIPQSEYAVASEAIRQGHLLNTEYEENDLILTIELPKWLADKLKAYSLD